MSDLSEQIAVVTGASGGIGGAIAASLSRQGAALYLVGRDEARLNERAAQLSTFSYRVEPARCDLTQDAQVETLCADLQRKHGRIDILVHCAGTIDHGQLADAPITMLDELYESNVRGPMLLTQKLLPLLMKPRGQVVFINSSAGLTARAESGYFSATQHAFKALAESLREEVNQHGIRVLSVYPGRTSSPRIRDLHAREGRPFQPDLLLQPEDIAGVVLGAIMLPWNAEITDIRIRPMQKSY